MKTIWILFFCLLSIVPFESSAQDDAVVIRTELLIESCREKIMSVNGGDLGDSAIVDIVKSCEGFPLSDDVAVQMLGAIVGPDFVKVLDVLTAFTGDAHGFEEDETLFSLLAPMHTVFYYFNIIIFGIFLFMLATHIALQILQWQRGNINVSPKGYLERYGVSATIKGTLAYPFMAWMNPLQFLALLCIAMFIWLAKMAVTYLFLASFFTNVGSDIKDSVEDALSSEVAASVLNFKCDLENREELLSLIQQNSDTGSSMAGVESSGLYQCLTNPSNINGVSKISRAPLSDGVVTYEIYPEAINQTRYCANQYKDVIENDWNEEVEDFYDCGGSYVNMPIGASEASIENVISLYMSGDVERAQREVALQLRELDCRGDEYPDYNNVIVDSCMIPRINGDGYSYETKTDDITGIESLSYYSLALSSESKKLLEGDIRRGVDAIKESLTSSTDKLITHFSDILSLISLDSLTEKQKELVQDRIDDWESELASNGLLGVSEGDVDNLITSIRRGMWASGTLFFSGISDSLDNKLLVQKLTQVYSVETSYSTILSYDYINLMNAVEWNDNGFVGNVFNGDIGHGLIIPRLGLYLDNMNCWEEQADCETPSLNPFTELSERGVAIMDHALIGIVVTKSVRGVMQYVAQKKLEYAGYDVAQAKKTRMGKYMLFDTFEEIYILYMFIALVLVVILPGMPLLKLSIMLMSWIYDVVKELVVLTLNIVLSPHSHIDEGFISDEVKESFQKILGLGLYFFFIVIGVIVMFIMFSFLYSLNVLVVGALNFIIDWSITVSSLEGMVMGIIMDTVIAALLVYEVRICTPYIDKLPQEMATYFNLNTSDTDGMVKHMERLLTSNVFMKVSGLLHK